MENASILFLWFVPFIFSLSFHEAAHAWTANRLGDPTARFMGRLTLNPLAHIDWIGTVLFPVIAFLTRAPLIGWARPVPVNEQNLKHRRRDGMWVAAAGPASNFLLAVLFTGAVYLLNRFSGEASVPRGGFSLLEPLMLMAQVGIQLNLILGVFNLIPVPPLDGGRIFFGLFPRYAARTAWLERYGFILLLILFMTGVVNRIIFYPTERMYYYLLRFAV